MTRLSVADIDLIKREHTVSTIAGQWVKLRAQRQGQFPLSGPCPLHSRDPSAPDSTSFACDDVAWVCVNCGGGDVFDLVAAREGFKARDDFKRAVALVTGGQAPRPRSAEETRALAEAAAEEKAARASEQNEFRDRERRAAWDLYYKYSVRLSHPDAGAARDYLALRLGRPFDHAEALHLRCNAAARYYVPDRPKPRLVHTGPALTAPIARFEEGCLRFAGVHMTFLDLAQPKGKLALADPKTGQPLPAKKMRGSKKGGHIDLFGNGMTARTLVLGEGIEKTLAIAAAMLEGTRDLAGWAFWAAGDLGNLGGKHAELTPHPTLKTATGRVQRVPGPEPDMDAPAITIPATVERLVLLGDSTSDRFTTECVLARAAARYAKPGREVVCAWGPEGKDFDDVLREAGA